MLEFLNKILFLFLLVLHLNLNKQLEIAAAKVGGFEQIKIDLNIMKLPVTILAVGASYSYDTSGPTHHSIDDIAILRTLGNFEIYSPSDNNVLKKIFNETLKSKIPNIVRLDRYFRLKILESVKR